MLDLGTSIAWVGMLMALVPAFVLFVYLARGKGAMWLVVLIGSVGWTVAYVRVPILQWLGQAFLNSWIRSTGTQIAPYVTIAVNALFAGLFEEGIRYGLVKSIQRTRSDLGRIFSFGLGWGFAEALVIYALPIVLPAYFGGGSISLSNLLLGAVERNMAIVIHLGLTFIIFRATTNVAFLFAAIGTHFAVNFVGLSLYTLTGNVWVTYVITLVVAFILMIYLYQLKRKRTRYPWWQIRSKK